MNDFALCETPFQSLNEILKPVEFVKKRGCEIANVACALDFETTSFYRHRVTGETTAKEPNDPDEWEKCATMYCFVIGIDGKTYIGRDWDDFESCFDRIASFYGLNEKRTMVFYVHNLDFDFQFFRKHIAWKDVFGINDRKPLIARSVNGLEFRCSYLLTGYALKTIGEHLTKYPVRKKVGDLDYRKLRHTKTPLTAKERGYVVNDALVVMAHIQQEIERLGNITRLPYTKTGAVRQITRNHCLYEYRSHKKGNAYFNSYREQMFCCQIKSEKEYRHLHYAFAGGFTHANAMRSGQVYHDVRSMDITSSYPAVMCSEQYPMQTGKLVKIKSFDHAMELMRYYCCVFNVFFTGLRERFRFDHYLSESKCVNLQGAKIDNGRIVSAETCATTITNVDFDIIRRCYEWDEIEFTQFRIYYRGYLPKRYVESVLDFYGKKTTLKGIEGMETEYNNAKENVNSLYGMTATNIVRPTNTIINDQWVTEEPDVAKELQRYNLSKSRFLCYQWAMFITAYARHNLWDAIFELGEDYIYSDTDSVKFVNADKHNEFFERYNRRIKKKIDACLTKLGIDPDLSNPCDKDGKPHQLGVYSLDGEYASFKTLGAKRYMVEYDEPHLLDKDTGYRSKYSVTISGLNKTKVVPYLEERSAKTGENLFDMFCEGMYIPKGKTGKMTHTYIDYPQEGELTDYLGNTEHFSELSSVHLEDADYELSLTQDYIDFILQVRNVD